MNKELQERLSQMDQIIGLELNELEKLEGEKLKRLRELLNIHWSPEPIFVNNTNIVITDINDYERIRGACPKWEEVIRLEIPEFNTYLYVGRYVNVQFLKDIVES